MEHIKDIGSVEGQDYGPSDILYLGANLTDYQAAKKVGLNFVALCSEPQDALELKAAGLEERRIICSFPPQIKSVFNELLRALEELDK
ncbi:MAG: hypothetical protein NTX66_04240 [Candidatus Falkowbacteria bacterium]|nr:hypothetical protein [Candidatus Falkowbacteria bacterium]